MKIIEGAKVTREMMRTGILFVEDLRAAATTESEKASVETFLEKYSGCVVEIPTVNESLATIEEIFGPTAICGKPN